MGFETVPAAAYARFMGRYADPLAPQFADWSGVPVSDRTGGPHRVLDVGCGPGALTQVLIDRLGTDVVAAIDPSPSFVAATTDRFPGLDVRQGAAESLPWPDGAFDAALAQLVVHFMTDPVQGLREMARVTVPGGTVAACVWDHSTSRGPLSLFWDAVRDLVTDAPDESGGNGTRAGHLAELATRAGLVDIVDGELTVTSEYADFDEWWEPYLAGVGPAGEYVARLDDRSREAIRFRAWERIGDGPFTVVATAWTVRGRST